MKETCTPIEELKEIVKEFMEIQINVNDAVNDDFEDMAKELEKLDEQTAETITKLLGRIIIIEKKIADIKEDNINIKRNFSNKADKKINKDINNIYHNLKEYRRGYNNFYEDVDDRINKLFAITDMLDNHINGVAELAYSTDRVVRAICADLDNKRERKENKNNASNK